MQKLFGRTFFDYLFLRQEKTVAKINRQKNCPQNKALQKCAADIFVYLLVERGKALSAAHRAH